MDSTRSFIGLWVLITLCILAYAGVDFWMHPWLQEERHFTMRPDISQIGDLWHWGGRLMKEGAVSLLIGNAIIVGGLLALVTRSAFRLVARLRGTADDDAPSTEFVDPHMAGATNSVPPPPSAA